MSKQSAIIKKIEKNKIFAEVQSKSACAHCPQKGNCSITDCQNKIIEIKVPDKHNYQQGQTITVSIDDKLGLWAAVYAYIIPLILIVSVLSISLFFTKNEEKSALLSLFSLILYYFLLFLCKPHFTKKITFKIEE